MIIDVLPHQKKFLLSEKTHTALIGGYGSGKSYAGVLKTAIKKMQYVGIPVAYYLPTYGLIRDVAIPKFEEIFDTFGVQIKINKSSSTIHSPYGEIFMRSMENHETIVGYEVGYSLIDETDILPKRKMTDAFVKIIGRNRANLPKGFINQTDVVGTPEGFKWLYEFFVKKPSDNKMIIKAKTFDNPFLPADYIPTLQDSYTPEQLEAYLNGEFVNLTSGTVYNAFDRKTHHSDRQATPNDVLHIGLDFNVTNMNAVIHVVDGKSKIAVAEITGVYDTFQMIEAIQSRFRTNQIVVYPDASGASRNTSGKSDHQLLKEARFTVRTPSKNPFVKDRVNAVNKVFMSGEYLVNTNNCPTYTEALEQQSYKNGEPDKTTGFDHVTEAGGYFVYYHVGKPTYSTSIRV